MSNDVDDLDAKDRRLCAECIGEPFLRGEVQRNGREDLCSYCKEKGPTLSIGEIADRIELALHQHFYLTPSEPSGLEYAMIKEGDLDWERKGDPVVDIIQDYAQIEPEPAENI